MDWKADVVGQGERPVVRVLRPQGGDGTTLVSDGELLTELTAKLLNL